VLVDILYLLWIILALALITFVFGVLRDYSGGSQYWRPRLAKWQARTGSPLTIICPWRAARQAPRDYSSPAVESLEPDAVICRTKPAP
jgi:hypothetical protein